MMVSPERDLGLFFLYIAVRDSSVAPSSSIRFSKFSTNAQTCYNGCKYASDNYLVCHLLGVLTNVYLVSYHAIRLSPTEAAATPTTGGILPFNQGDILPFRQGHISPFKQGNILPFRHKKCNILPFKKRQCTAFRASKAVRVERQYVVQYTDFHTTQYYLTCPTNSKHRTPTP